MARPFRCQYEGAIYHVTVRGNERRAIFRDDADRRRFLETLRALATLHNCRA
jgi:REP element-mobilizing transposase RayT